MSLEGLQSDDFSLGGCAGVANPLLHSLPIVRGIRCEDRKLCSVTRRCVACGDGLLANQMVQARTQIMNGLAKRDAQVWRQLTWCYRYGGATAVWYFFDRLKYDLGANSRMRPPCRLKVLEMLLGSCDFGANANKTSWYGASRVCVAGYIKHSPPC